MPRARVTNTVIKLGDIVSVLARACSISGRALGGRDLAAGESTGWDRVFRINTSVLARVISRLCGLRNFCGGAGLLDARCERPGVVGIKAHAGDVVADAWAGANCG